MKKRDVNYVYRPLPYCEFLSVAHLYMVLGGLAMSLCTWLGGSWYEPFNWLVIWICFEVIIFCIKTIFGDPKL